MRHWLIGCAILLATFSNVPGGATSASMPPPGDPATPAELRAIAALFDDQPFEGGQVQPRVAKATTPETFVFLQLDKANAQTANELVYVGIGDRGRFCDEHRADHSFSHFHRWLAPAYAAGHGTIPTAEGYWMTWTSVAAGSPGVAYGLFPTPAQECGDAARLLPELQAALSPVSPDEASAIEALFDDAPFAGGQASPYVAKWINENVFLFLEPAADGGAWPHVGLGVRGTFCAESQPTPDFTRFQQHSASTWEEGRGGAGGEGGYWLAHLGTGAGSPTIGIDRAYDPTPPPTCA